MSEHEVCCVCRGDVPTVGGHLVTHRHRDQFGPCPAGQVEPTATGDKLAEAERIAREHVRAKGMGWFSPDLHVYLGALLAELDRMRAELAKTVADCGICRLGGRTIQINDDCPRHGDTDGEGL